MAVLRDAVLETGLTESLDTTLVAWLYEFERIRTRRKNSESIIDATDEVFSAYWYWRGNGDGDAFRHAWSDS